MLKSSLCDYSDAYILFKGRIKITGVGDNDNARQAGERDKGVIFKNCAPLTNCKNQINNAEIEHDKDIDIVIPMYNLIECSDNYLKRSGSLSQYPRDELNANLTDFKSFKSKINITGNIPADGNTKNVKLMVPLQYLSNF